MRVDRGERLDQIGACRAEPRLRARHLGLHDRVVGEPGEPARRLAGRQRNELGQHRARDAERHGGDPARVEALHGKGIERAALAAQRRVLARGAERLGHEQIVDGVGVRRRAAQPDRLPGVEQGRLSSRKQQRADRGPAEAVEPQRAVRFEHMAVRAHPAGLPAAAGEIPLAGQAIAAVNRLRARSVWRSPGHDAARIGEDGAIDRGLQIGGDQGGTVGDEYVPRDRGVVPGELFDRRHVDRRLRLVATSRARQQHAEQPGVMEPPQQRLGDAPRALDLVGRG